jgi:hypothetical protein
VYLGPEIRQAQTYERSTNKNRCTVTGLKFPIPRIANEFESKKAIFLGKITGLLLIIFFTQFQA